MINSLLRSGDEQRSKLRLRAKLFVESIFPCLDLSPCNNVTDFAQICLTWLRGKKTKLRCNRRRIINSFCLISRLILKMQL